VIHRHVIKLAIILERFKMSEYEFSSQYMDTKRLETLVDGIFAIAMTMLVLGLDVQIKSYLI
jgi:hypothetical protein